MHLQTLFRKRQRMKAAKDLNRNAFTSTEIVVACSLLVATMSAISMLMVKTTRLWQDSRHQQMAMEELCRELDRLTALPPDARDSAMEQLHPSPLLKSASPNASITASWDDDQKTALVLELDWNDEQPKAPVQLVGWIRTVIDGELP
jgi:hypothetical protein